MGTARGASFMSPASLSGSARDVTRRTSARQTSDTDFSPRYTWFRLATGSVLKCACAMGASPSGAAACLQSTARVVGCPSYDSQNPATLPPSSPPKKGSSVQTPNLATSRATRQVPPLANCRIKSARSARIAAISGSSGPVVARRSIAASRMIGMSANWDRNTEPAVLGICTKRPDSKRDTQSKADLAELFAPPTSTTPSLTMTPASSKRASEQILSNRRSSQFRNLAGSSARIATRSFCIS